MNATEPTGATPKPKRWPVALLVGLITGIAGAVLAVPVSDWAMEAHHVSTMEGGRACAAVGIFAPLAFLVGFATGFVVSLRIKRAGFAGYLICQGISLAIIIAIVFAVSGLGYATADHPPLIDGKNLALEIEVRVPAKGRSIQELQAADFDVALIVSTSDRHYSYLRWSEATKSDEFITVPAWAPLKSRNAGREITAALKGENPQIFSVMRHASPKKIDDEWSECWSEWTPPKQRFDGSKPTPEDQYLARYRVRFAKEYAPTPTPTATPSAVMEPSPDENATSEKEESTAEPSGTP